MRPDRMHDANSRTQLVHMDPPNRGLAEAPKYLLQDTQESDVRVSYAKRCLESPPQKLRNPCHEVT